MPRKFIESFTATHFTILAALAMIVPSALYAVPSFTNVAIMDPNTGSRAFVDPARRVYVFDPIAGYRNNPANAVEINFSNTGDHCETQTYKIPAGKALIITAISGWTAGPGGGTASGYSLTDAAGCRGRTLSDWITQDAYAPIAVDFGSGIPVSAGRTLSIFSGENSGFTRVHGYLIPASALPAAAEAGDAPLQGAVGTVDTVKAKLAASKRQR